MAIMGKVLWLVMLVIKKQTGHAYSAGPYHHKGTRKSVSHAHTASFCKYSERCSSVRQDALYSNIKIYDF